MSKGLPLTKRVLAAVLDRTGILRADLALRGPEAAIAVNYHRTPQHFGRSLEAQFAFYRDHFECLGEEDLLHFLAGSRRLSRPGIVISFDDGHRDNATVAAPRLEALGLRGWFMLAGGFLDEPGQTGGSADAMTWEDARALVKRGHVIGCHTWSHCPLGPRVSRQRAEDEVALAKRRLEAKLGCRVRTFCWVRGRVGDYSARAHRLVSQEYDVAFMTMGRAIHPGTHRLELHRFNVEASFSLPLVRFQISRFNEAAFARRRRAVQAVVRNGV